MFIGEAPGADEDRQGIPFVGRAGQRLTRWVEWLGMRRDDVYIANVLKCRPPNNRDPSPPEVARCSPFLRAQIRAIQPRVIVALGRHAGNLLLENSQPLSLRAMRGRVMRYEQREASIVVPLVVTYHPSYVLRRESEEQREARGQRDGPSRAEQDVYADLRVAMQALRGAPGPSGES